MSIIALPADVIRLITSYLELPGIHALSTTSWHFQRMLCGNPDFWWHLVRQQLTENPTSLAALCQDNVNIREMLEGLYSPPSRDSRVVHYGRALFLIEDASKYLLEKFIEKHIEDISSEQYACFVCYLAQHGHLEAFKDYRERQDDVSHQGLMSAAQKGHLDIVKYIVEKRDTSSDAPNYDDEDNYEEEGYTPGITIEHLNDALEYAVQEGSGGDRANNQPVIDYLKSQGASVRMGN